MNLLLAGRHSRSQYDLVSESSAAVVIKQYSSSFGVASRLLPGAVRSHIRNIYALVRVADEIVDHPDPLLGRAPRERMLSMLYDDVAHALQNGYSGNLVVHAFARTAAWCGIGADLVDPFFASMRMDLATRVHTRDSFDEYVYGSAEVVGLMCLRAFLTADAAATATEGHARDTDAEYERLAPGARRLGAAFQKLNFLRDIAEDHDSRGRDYFPGVDIDRFSDSDRDAILDDIATDLDAAAAAIPNLPISSRRAVHLAHATFAELATRLRATPASQIRHRRVRVPALVKLRLVAESLPLGRP